MNLDPNHEAFRERVRAGALTEPEREALVRLLDHVQSAAELHEHDLVGDDGQPATSEGYWSGTHGAYRDLVPRQLEHAVPEQLARDDALEAER